MKVAVGGLLLLASLGCGGGEPGEEFALYHLEADARELVRRLRGG